MASSLTKISTITKQSGIIRNFSAFGNSHSLLDKGSQEIHGTAAQKYPSAAALKLPDNFQDINASEVGQFSPLRSRDISGSVLTSNTNSVFRKVDLSQVDITVDSDPHLEPYDCRGAVNLSSSMQSNVPSPFGGQNSILGMPGSQWGQGYKYLSDYCQNSHYLNLRNQYSRAIHSYPSKKGKSCLYHTLVSNYFNNHVFITKSLILTPHTTKNFATDESPVTKKAVMEDTTKTDQSEGPKKLPSKVDQLKQAVAAYGSTVIVFHVTISLMSLGGFYLLVNSGIDVMAFLEYLGISDGVISKKVTANTGTFVLAYAIHKVFAPVRIGITLTATPFIVRHLRKIGILKTPIKVK